MNFVAPGTTDIHLLYMSRSSQKSSAVGFSGDFIGAAIGAAIGAKAGGPQGAAMGAQLGKAVGGSVGFNSGSGSGSANVNSNGEASSNAESSATTSQSRSNAHSMMSLLEVDIKLYEIVLDEVKPSDFSPAFLSDLLSLPSSYYQIGAALKFQDFIQVPHLYIVI